MFPILVETLLLVSITIGDASRNIHVSRVRGNDTASCGSIQLPCYSIPEAIRISQWKDHVYIDSTNTESSPYDCHPVLSPWLFVNKSLSFFGYPLMANLACHAGFYFVGKTKAELQIEFTKLSFKSTRLKFMFSSVKLSNCFINDGEDASVDFNQDQLLQTLFVENTTFTNNSQCIKISSAENVAAKFGFTTILIVKNTIFKSNCLQGKANGIISLYSTPGSNNLNDTILASFTILTFLGNSGPLILFNNSKGKFEGYYSNIRVIKNVYDLERMSDSSAQCSLLEITAHTVNLSFVDALFASNHGCRCLAIDAKRITLSIRHSRFVAHQINGNGGVLLVRKTQRLFVNIEDTEFAYCRGYDGGAFRFTHKNNKIDFNARNVVFNRCKANNSGGAISMNGNNASLILENVTLIKCRADEFGGGISINVASLSLNIVTSTWKTCNSFFGKALYISVTRYCVISIGNSEFRDTQSVPTSFNTHTVYVYATQNNAGSLNVYDTKFLTNSQPYAIWTIDTISVNLTRLYFTRASMAALAIISNTLQSTAEVYVDGCVFKNNSGGIMLFFQDANVVNVTVKNSYFLKGSNINGYAGGQAISIKALQISSCTSSFVLFENISVEENRFLTLFPDAAVSVDLGNFYAKEGNTVKVIKSSFIKNHNLETSSASDGKAAALLVVMPADNVSSPGCLTDDDTFLENHREWHYKNKILIVNTSFENNIGVTGALYTSNGATRCINCVFKDNIVISRSGQVHIGEYSGKLELINSTFLESRATSGFLPQNIQHGIKYQKSTFIYSYSAGPLFITGTVFISEVSKLRSPAIIISQGGYLSMANRSLLLCPTGSKLVIENFSHIVATEYHEQSCKISITVVTLLCQVCSSGTYSLQRGNSTNISNTTKGFNCFACPYGANCHRNVVAKTNFWGYEAFHNPPQLQFVTCPAGYCITPNSLDTAVYNDCYGNRVGTLCGKCKQGFTEELMSTSCIDQTECNSQLFWSLLVLFSFLVAWYFLLKPTMFSVIYKQISWFRTQDAQDVSTDAGYTKIVFYFYQIAGILLLETYMELIEKTSILSTVISAFSFHITVGSSKTIGCPFIGMTPITKVIFTNIGVLTILFCIFIVFIAHMIFCKVKGTNIEKIPYLAAILELLLLGYANIAKAALKLLTCVTIGSQSVLFLEGNTPCWQWWQIAIGISVALFMVPFIVILYWGSRKYYEQKISPKEMLLAMVLPVPYTIYKTYTFFNRRWNHSRVTEFQDEEEEEMVGWSRFTNVLYGPFRSPTEEVKGALHWESVLVGRRLCLLSIHAFVVDPLLRMFLLTLTCVAILYHHLLVFPFKEAKANHLEAISLLALAVIANINLCKAVLWSVGITPIGPNLTHIKILEWTEVVLLAVVPFIFAVFLACFIVLLLLRLVFILAHCARIGYSSLKTFIFVEEDRPLMAN